MWNFKRVWNSSVHDLSVDIQDAFDLDGQILDFDLLDNDVHFDHEVKPHDCDLLFYDLHHCPC